MTFLWQKKIVLKKIVKIRFSLNSFQCQLHASLDKNVVFIFYELHSKHWNTLLELIWIIEISSEVKS